MLVLTVRWWAALGGEGLPAVGWGSSYSFFVDAMRGLWRGRLVAYCARFGGRRLVADCTVFGGDVFSRSVGVFGGTCGGLRSIRRATSSVSPWVYSAVILIGVFVVESPGSIRRGVFWEYLAWSLQRLCERDARRWAHSGHASLQSCDCPFWISGYYHERGKTCGRADGRRVTGFVLRTLFS